MLVYKGSSFIVFNEQNYSYAIENTRLLKFLMVDSGKAIFITTEHNIVDYDYQGNSNIWNMQLSEKCDVTSKLITGGVGTSSWGILFGTDCGDVI